MSVLIKGMEMPKTCDDCILLRHYRFLGEPILCCVANDRVLVEVEEYERDKKRLSDCPLVEVLAPHGDLIDINSKITVAIKDGLKVTTVRDLLDDKAVRLPKTVIEAEIEVSK